MKSLQRWNKVWWKYFRRSLVISGLIQLCLCILAGGFLAVSDALSLSQTGVSFYVQIVNFLREVLNL